MTSSVGNLVRTWSALFCVLAAIVTIAFVMVYANLSDRPAMAALVLCAATIVVSAASIIREQAWLVLVAAVLLLAAGTFGTLSLKVEKPGVHSLEQVHGRPVVHQLQLVHLDQAQFDHVRDQHAGGAER